MIPTYTCRPHTPEADRLELAARRVQDVVDSLKQDLEDLEMVLYYTGREDPRWADLNQMHERTYAALTVTRKALTALRQLVSEAQPAGAGT